MLNPIYSTTAHNRVKTRLNGEEYDEEILKELETGIFDRVAIRLDCANSYDFPTAFLSIVVDATIKAWRRRLYEGISNENIAEISDSFYENLLSEYDSEFEAFKNSSDSAERRKKVRLL